jgi:hypothetical protein
MKKYILLFCIMGLLACNNQDKSNNNAFVGTWHLESMSDGYADKGLLMYSPDGHMTAILSKNDSMKMGYSGRYEVNNKEAYVTHYRDFYNLIPYPSDSIEPAFIRDFTLSEDQQTLILRARELNTLTLVWKKVRH